MRQKVFTYGQVSLFLRNLGRKLNSLGVDVTVLSHLTDMYSAELLKAILVESADRYGTADLDQRFFSARLSEGYLGRIACLSRRRTRYYLDVFESFQLIERDPSNGPNYIRMIYPHRLFREASYTSSRRNLIKRKSFVSELLDDFVIPVCIATRKTAKK